jgi:hypothetical protein
MRDISAGFWLGLWFWFGVVVICVGPLFGFDGPTITFLFYGCPGFGPWSWFI